MRTVSVYVCVCVSRCGCESERGSEYECEADRFQHLGLDSILSPGEFTSSSSGLGALSPLM